MMRVSAVQHRGNVGESRAIPRVRLLGGGVHLGTRDYQIHYLIRAAVPRKSVHLEVFNANIPT
jgi:hypothetical protein